MIQVERVMGDWVVITNLAFMYSFSISPYERERMALSLHFKEGLKGDFLNVTLFLLNLDHFAFVVSFFTNAL
jgi:hypothetical protein